MANVPVDKKQWDGLPEADRARISDIMRTTGLIQPGDKFVGAATPSRRAAKFAAANPVCMLGCNAAEAAAVAACAAIPAPGNAICVAVAHAAADYCRSK